MWRLRFLPWRWILVGGGAILLLVAAGVAFAVILGGKDKKAVQPTAVPQPSINLFYLRAVRPQTQIRDCKMKIRFHWKPDYHANQYIGSKALIVASGSGIAGSYRRPFTKTGVVLDAGTVSLAGGYQLWSAKVATVDGDPPGNDTTVSTAPPATTKCR
jgi:hypothetical protein